MSEPVAPPPPEESQGQQEVEPATTEWTNPAGHTLPPSDPYTVPISATAPLPIPYPPPPATFPHQPVLIGEVGYAFDPLTGRPFSDRSKLAAGLLQLLPGIVFSLGGIGRLYAGNTALGVAQLVASVVGWICFWCGFVFLIPWAIYGLIWLWFVADAIVIFAGRPLDGQGRPLRA
jgi:hypothetical protein